MGKDYKLLQMYMPYYGACVSTTFGFFFFFLSFSSPYWLQSYAGVHNRFLHMGIWQVCFNRFVHPQDYHANILTGCYWIFDRFFFRIGIWQWLDPHWLIAIQVLITIAFIIQCCVILIFVLYHLLFGHPAAESTMAMGGELSIGILLTICVLIFGIKSEDRTWMPRPDQNFLAWSYGFAILAAISSYIAAGFLYCVSYTHRAAEEEVERFEAAAHQYGMTSVISGKGGSVYGRSVYGTSQGFGGVVVKVPSSGVRPEQVLTLDSGYRRMNGEGTASLFTPSLVPSNYPPQGGPLETLQESDTAEDLDTHDPLMPSGGVYENRRAMASSVDEQPYSQSYASPVTSEEEDGNSYSPYEAEINKSYGRNNPPFEERQFSRGGQRRQQYSNYAR